MECTMMQNVKRLNAVRGYEDRINDVIYCAPKLMNLECDSTVVFFGGDVQDFLENMKNQRDSKDYEKWNLEETALILQNSFSSSHIIVIRPLRMAFNTFSCYKNFVECNDLGCPEHLPHYNSLQHLEKLLINVAERLENEYPIENLDVKSKINITSNNLILVGFSKGCVVLNQFLHEFNYFETVENNSQAFLQRISDIYWLDGGHAGGKNTWITSKVIIESLTKLNITIHIHLTPYQVNDDRRPWIKKEEKTFSDTLTKFGAKLNRTLHFASETPTLAIHFNVLTAFKVGKQPIELT